ARPRWPMIVLETPKGWTGPKVVDGVQVEGTWRAHQVPLAELASRPGHLRMLEEWMRSYEPAALFGADGSPVQQLRELIPQGDRRLGATAYANGGRLLQHLQLPDVREFAFQVKSPGAQMGESTRILGTWLREVFRLNAKSRNFRMFGPDETASNRLDAVFE